MSTTTTEVGDPAPHLRASVLRIERRRPTSRRFWIVVGVVALAGLGLRLGYVASYQFLGYKNYGKQCQGKEYYSGCNRFLEHEVAIGLGGDALYYHDQAYLLLHGHLFIDPSQYYGTGAITPSASHPPLYTVVVAAEDVIGLTTADEQRIAGCFLGAFSIMVIALAARRIAGDAAGIVAAVVAALYPGLWIYNGTDMSETVSMLVVAYLIHEAYRFLRSPSMRRACWLGVVAGLAAYSRSELVLLSVLLVVPVAFFVRRVEGIGWKGSLRLAGASLGTTVLVLAPWMGFNLARFSHTELLSTQFGMTLAVSNCDRTYHGPFTGFWDLPRCLIHRPPTPGIGRPPRHVDESVVDAYWRRVGLAYMTSHAGRVVPVILAREGRVWWLYQSAQQENLDAFIEQWDLGATIEFRWSFTVLALASLGGLAAVRFLRKHPVTPLLAPAAVVCVAVFATYGTTRFQSSAEPTIVIASSVAFTVGVPWVLRRFRASPDGHSETDGDPGSRVLVGGPTIPGASA